MVQIVHGQKLARDRKAEVNLDQEAVQRVSNRMSHIVLEVSQSTRVNLNQEVLHKSPLKLVERSVVFCQILIPKVVVRNKCHKNVVN